MRAEGDLSLPFARMRRRKAAVRKSLEASPKPRASCDGLARRKRCSVPWLVPFRHDALAGRSQFCVFPEGFLGCQHQSLKFLASGTKATKLVNRRSRWRERKRLERFAEPR